jgi:hypothetical protein
MPRRGAVLVAHLAAGLSIRNAMGSVYRSAQVIACGLVSVLFGLPPILTGVMAQLRLAKRAMAPAR